MLPAKFKNVCSRQLGQLWRAWRGLGLFSNGGRSRVGIEEALIGLCVLGRYDQRLFDEAVSLLISYSGLINKNKIKYMIGKADPASSSVFSVVAALLVEHAGDRRFKPMAVKGTLAERIHAKPFFISFNKRQAFSGSTFDPLFFQYGWKRNIFRNSDNVPRLPVIAALNPFIKSKIIFGNTVRADIIMELLMNGQCIAPELARKNGFAQKSVWNVMTDLAAAGIVDSVLVQNKVVYKLGAGGKPMLSLLKNGPVVSLWQEWIKVGHYLYHLDKLPPTASPLLIKSEEQRVAKLLG